MAYSEVHYLFAFGGPLRVNEEWSQTLRFADGFALQSQAEEEDALEAMALALQTWWTGAGSGVSGSGATLAWAKLNRIGVDGKYVHPYTNLYEYPSPGSSPNGSTHPNQVACVVTLETGFTRGLAHRGRMFFPIPRYPIDTATGLLSVANAQDAADRVAVLLDTLNAAWPNMQAHVYSGTREGAHRPVTGTSCGRVLDTMRSRRTQLVEERSTAAVAAVP